MNSTDALVCICAVFKQPCDCLFAFNITISNMAQIAFASVRVFGKTIAEEMIPSASVTDMLN